jgi:hypothetical protein
MSVSKFESVTCTAGKGYKRKQRTLKIRWVIQVRQANFLFHMAFHIQKRKLTCHTLYNRWETSR